MVSERKKNKEQRMHFGLLILLSVLPFFRRYYGRRRLPQLQKADRLGSIVAADVWDKVVVEVVGHGGKKRAREWAEKAMDFWPVVQRALKCSSLPSTTMRHTPPLLDVPDVPDDAQRHPLLAFRPHQPYAAFLVLDVEATCFQGTDFNYPNEIIVCSVLLLT